jgi:hypothetical protein
MVPKKRGPQDLTLRNLRALKKRVSILEQEMAMLIASVALMSTGQPRKAKKR